MSAGPRFGNIGVLMGGYSSEREISLKSGRAVAAALSAAGHQVTPVDITAQDKQKIIEQVRSAGMDIAFIALHGRLGEDGVIASILEEMDILYTGSGPQAGQKAFNKITAQRIFKTQGLAVADHVCISDGKIMDFKEAFAALKKLPFVVKAACEGSSIGIYVVRHPSQWEGAIRDALSFGPQVIIEKFIKGRELTAGILDREALPLVEIQPKGAFFDFTSKYQKGLAQYTVPAQVPEDLGKQRRQLALAAHEALDCRGFSRVDIRVDEEMRPFILEINTIPGFTETSLFPKAAQEAGYSFIDVCEKLLDLANGKETQR
ncbi:MAG: D-alanine--D-alanine ligase [Candidatus Omnitrophica bacterium]|nr:D-alanine--D-alanine ligase [Candidatus Omnitrophota bacterium]